jgi:ubiquinol-cytochrome c reductase iron-sulfur subunit
MSKLRLLLAGLLFLLGFRRAREAREAPERIVSETRPDRRAETLVALLLGAAGLCSVGFVVVFALDDVPAQTQFLGLSIGLALAAFAAACVLTGKRLVPTEELEEPYPGEHPQEQEEVVRIVDESKDAITRRRLLGVAAGGAGAAFGVALLAPLVSLGPLLDTDRLYRTPWRAGRRLVDEEGRPYTAGEIQPDTFYTAYPEDADPEQVGAPLVVVRLDVSALKLPSGRHGWAPHGILAYSKICTHAGCALALYRTPLYEPTTPGPALVCPCHYSTFDPATGGTVLFGPAGRPLPQLPLRIDDRGRLRAGGGFSGPVGPSWWGVRKK